VKWKEAGRQSAKSQKRSVDSAVFDSATWVERTSVGHAEFLGEEPRDWSMAPSLWRSRQCRFAPPARPPSAALVLDASSGPRTPMVDASRVLRGMLAVAGGASCFTDSCSGTREVVANLSIARHSPPARTQETRGRERLTKAIGHEMLDRCAAPETRTTIAKVIQEETLSKRLVGPSQDGVPHPSAGFSLARKFALMVTAALIKAKKRAGKQRVKLQTAYQVLID
jgi:hypothetical protein